MNTSIRSTETGACGRPRRTALGPAKIAGTSFKHEHLTAILEQGLHDGFFEVRAVRRIAR
jgi:hypothetical protein